MALQGTFLADFESFYAAVQKAEVSLKGFETSAAKVETSLNRMVDTFSGRKLITEATLAAEAIERMGGVSKLTANELATWGSKAEEAVNKIHALGDRAEPTLLKLAAAHKESAKATDEAAKANQGWAASLGQVDAILGQLGIHVGSEARALGELEGAAGKSAGQIGLLGTAGLVVGTAMAAWGITRAAMEFLQLDQYVAKAWTSLLGFGDAAKETAAANADVLAKASATAGVQITSLADAMKINAEAVEKHAAAVDTGATRLARWRSEIEGLKSGGALEKFKADLDSGAFSVDELTKRYHLSSEAIAQFTKDTKAAGDAEKEAADKIHANNERMLKDVQTQMDANKVARDLEAKALLQTTKLWDEYYALRISHGGTTNDTARAQIEQWAKDTEAAAIKAGTATKGFYDALAADSREKLAAVGINWDLWKTSSIKSLNEVADNERRTLEEMITSGQFRREEIDKQRAKYEDAREAARGYGKDAAAAQEAGAAAAAKHTAELERQTKALEAAAAANRAMGNSTQLDMSTEAGRAKVDPAIAQWLHDGYSLEQASAIAFAMAWGFPLNMNDPLFRTKGPRVPGFASGVQDFGGGLALVGERGPELVNLPGGADVIPIDRAPAGGGGVTIQNTFHIVDTEANIARRVSEQVMRQIVIGRKLGFA